MKKNVHSAMIVEWAITNKPVQVLWYGVWTDAEYPTWRDEFEYRFKPEVVRSRRYIFLTDGEYQVSTVIDDEGMKWAEESDLFVRWIDEDFVTHTV